MARWMGCAALVAWVSVIVYAVQPFVFDFPLGAGLVTLAVAATAGAGALGAD